LWNKEAFFYLKKKKPRSAFEGKDKV
jgi:hypothetical protein